MDGWMVDMLFNSPVSIIYISCISSFLGSTAQLRPRPPPQNPAELLGGFSKIFFFYRVGLLAPRPTPTPEDQASVFISPRSRVATHFSRRMGYGGTILIPQSPHREYHVYISCMVRR
jgi:hypothetical protein